MFFLNNLNDIILYLDDINSYVNSILYYYTCPSNVRQELNLTEILMYLSAIPEIIQDIKSYLYSKE